MKYVENAKNELKEVLTNEVKEEIIAFLNSNGGNIYIGVTNQGEAIGFCDLKERDSLDIKIGNWIEDAFYPVPSRLIKHYFNNDNVLTIEVSEGNQKPYFLKEKGPKPSGVFKRVGSSKRHASEDEILQMIFDSKGYDYESSVSEEQELTFKTLESYFMSNELNLNKRAKVSLGIIDANGEFTNLGYLLSDQANIVIKLAVYDENLSFKVKKSFTGSLLKSIFAVKEQAERFNDTSAVIDGKTFKRIETTSYPGASLREIIMNAFCHANYSLRSNIKIEFFPDRVKIISPGGIYNASMEDIMNGVQTYRNPKLIRVLDKLKLIENYGTGIPRTIMAYDKYSKKPLFEATNNFFTVTLPNINYVKSHSELNTDQIKDQIKDQINDQINDLGLEILKYIKSNEGCNVPMILAYLNNKDKEISADMIRNEIKRELRKYVEHRGSNKTGGYFIK